MSESTQDDVRAAVESLGGMEGGQDAPASSPSPSEAPPPTNGQADASTPQAPPEPPPSTESNGTAQAQRPRDSSGRFLKADAQAAPPPQPGAASATQPPAAAPATNGAHPPAAQTPVPELRAPQSWKPLAREKWQALAREVQEEVLRREQEVQRALQDAAPLRKQLEHLAEVAAPLRQMGVDPVTGFGHYVQVQAILQNGPPHQKAQLLASVIRQTGVPVEMLAAALDGQPMPQGQQAPIDAGSIAKQVQQQIYGEMQRAQQMRLANEAQTEVGRMSEKFEFFDDVRNMMGILMAAAADAGQPMTDDEAYDLACSRNKDIAAILSQRKAAETATASNAATQRARTAATSLKSQPAAAPSAQGSGSTVDDVRAAIAELSRGR